MRKIIFFCVLLLMFFTILEVNKTYGLFETNNVINADSSIAKWQIKVNDSIINTTETFNVDNIYIEEDENIASGKFAPNSSGYFDIEIDPNDTGVSFRYDISFDFSKLENSQIRVTNIEEINSYPLLLTNVDTYAGVMLLSDIENDVVHTIRVHLEWINNEDNNFTDSEYGLNINKQILIPINLHLTQYLGETIMEYVSPTE